MRVERGKMVLPRCSFCGEEVEAVVVGELTRGPYYEGYKYYEAVRACATCISKAMTLILFKEESNG